MSDDSISIEISTSTLYDLETFTINISANYTDLYVIIDEYSFSVKGGVTYLYLLTAVIVNHGCSNKHSFRKTDEAFPSTKHIFNVWNAVDVRIVRELGHVYITLRDVKKGKMITNDYKFYDKCIIRKYKDEFIEELEEWCD